MKTVQLTALILTLGISYPLYSQKYHDAILEEANGPVQTIKYENRTLEYSTEGELLTIEGKKPFISVERDAQGYITNTTGETHLQGIAKGLIAKDFNRYTYEEQGRVATNVWINEDPLFDSRTTTLYMYYYDRNGLCVKTEVYDMDKGGTEPKRIWYYEHVRIDEQGNWTERNYRVVEPALLRIDPEKLKAMGYAPDGVTERGTESRTISYYDNLSSPSRQQQSARNTTPTKQPGELSITDMVNHPFGILGTSITYSSALQSLRQNREWDISTTDQSIIIHDISGYKYTHDGIPISYVSAFFLNDRLYSFDFEFDFLKGDDGQAAFANAKATAERMVSRLQDVGITLIPQENSSYELYYAKGEQGNKTIEISVREGSYTAVLDCYRIYFKVTMR